MAATRFLRPLTLALALVAVTPIASACDHARRLARFDADKNGTLDEGERTAAKAAVGEHREERKEKVLARFDADKDGTLDEGERAAAKAAVGERLKTKHPELFARIDTNHDGTLDQSERKAAREHRCEHRKGAAGSR